MSHRLRKSAVPTPTAARSPICQKPGKPAKASPAKLATVVAPPSKREGRRWRAVARPSVEAPSLPAEGRPLRRR